MEGGSITTGTGRPTSSDARDRAVGALVGLAVGDAVGTALEFRAPGTFTPIDDMVGGGPFGLEPGQWTDDTSMAMCLAESILDIGELDLADQLLGGGHELPFPLTQEMLGELTGLTPVHTNRVLRKLRSDGVMISERQRIEILDLPKLAEIADYRPPVGS